MARKLIIDTDPGVDDMVAILAALGCEDLELLALTTVGGNVPVSTTTRNALRILARVGRLDVPVFPGLAAKLTAEEVHGDDGLTGCPWPTAPIGPQPEPAVEFLIRSLAVGDVTFACLGPLTNLAAALTESPALAPKIEQVVLMGGGFGTYEFPAPKRVVDTRGNVTPEAEFNIFSDIEAAQTVFGSGVRLIVAPLDVSHRTLVDRQRLDAMGALGSFGRDVARTLDSYADFTRDLWGIDDGPLHDPNVVAWIAQPHLYQSRQGIVRVGDNGSTEFTADATGPHRVLFDVDAEGYLDWVQQGLSRAGRV